MTTTQDAKTRAQDTAQTATDEGRHVAGVAQDEVQKVASEAADQVRSVAGDALSQVTGQLDEQSRAQRDRVAGLLTTFGDDLGRMAGEADSNSIATQVAREAASRARSLGQQLEQREPAELLDDVRRFARQRPGVFLLGALAAGVVAGRVLRGAKDGATTATGSQTLPTAGPEFGAAPTGTPTTNPPMPDVTPGHRTMDAPADTLTDEGPMGTPAAGYGERGVTGGDPS